MYNLTGLLNSSVLKAFFCSLLFFLLIPSMSSASENFQITGSKGNIVIAKGRLFIGMTKKEAYDVEGVPYRVRRLSGEDGKEMWIYQCNNEDGFNEDCLYLYFKGDELEKIERP